MAKMGLFMHFRAIALDAHMVCFGESWRVLVNPVNVRGKCRFARTWPSSLLPVQAQLLLLHTLSLSVASSMQSTYRRRQM
jgi:hypothetical protein